MRVAIGPGVVFRYVILGLFHPARKVSKSLSWCLSISFSKLSDEALFEQSLF